MAYKLKTTEDGTPLIVANGVGKKYGMLTVVKYLYSIKNGKSNLRHFVLCKCDCGIEKPIEFLALSHGKPFSCGCYSSKLKSERFSKHGMSGTKFYTTYRSILNRCYDKNNKKYSLYGGAGKVVCFGWRNKETGFVNFKNDMWPKTNKTIDRIKGEFHYSCGHCEECTKNGWLANCRWSDYETQNNNTTRNVFVEYKGRKVTITQLSRIVGVNDRMLHYRLSNGWSVHDAISIPSDSQSLKPNKNILVSVGGVLMSMAQAERKLGYTRGIISNRIKRGWSKGDAVSIQPRLGNKVKIK